MTTSNNSIGIEKVNSNLLANVSTSKKTVIQKTNDLADILYEVETNETTIHRCISNQRFVTFVYPNDIKTQVNTCSDIYTLVHNSEIFGKAKNILADKGIVFSESYEIINYSRFYGTFIIEGFDFSIGEGDVIKPILKIQHSYCGTTKYKINFGYFRLICSNGMVIPVEEMNDYNFSIIGKHTEKINESLTELFEKIDYFVNNTELFTANFKMLQNFKVVNPTERIEEILKACKIVLTDNKNFNTVNYILNRMYFESGDFNLEVTDWLIYNAINFFIYNEYRPMEAPEKKEETDGKVLSYMVKTCKSCISETDLFDQHFES